jgi:hypothetical protein
MVSATHVDEHLLQPGAAFAVRAAVVTQPGFDRLARNQAKADGIGRRASLRQAEDGGAYQCC